MIEELLSPISTADKEALMLLNFTASTLEME